MRDLTPRESASSSFALGFTMNGSLPPSSSTLLFDSRAAAVADAVPAPSLPARGTAPGRAARRIVCPTLLGGCASPLAVAVNLFASERRMALALGVERLDDVGERIAELLNLKVPEGLLGKLAMLPKLAEVAKFPPKTIGGRAPCQELVLQGSDIDLSCFPVPVCWPEDGGPYITLPGVIARDPQTGVRNVGMYRIQVLGKAELAMHWQRHKVGAAHWRAMADRG